MTAWDHIADWWVAEVRDPAYREEVFPLLLDLLAPSAGERVLDLGCGEGTVMAAVAERGADVVGLDGSEELARRAGRAFVSYLPHLDPVRGDAVDAAYVVLVLEHIPDIGPFFREVHRVVRPGGRLVVVLNHPFYSAPGAAPVTDPTDLEVYWRMGTYLADGSSDEPAGEGTIRFHHRPLGRLLTMAAEAGWSLERFEERGVGVGQVRRDPMLAAQAHIPRLAAIRWHR